MGNVIWRTSQTKTVRGHACFEPEGASGALGPYLFGKNGVIFQEEPGEWTCILTNPKAANKVIEVVQVRMAPILPGESLVFRCADEVQEGIDFLSIGLTHLEPIAGLVEAKVAGNKFLAGITPEFVLALIPLAHQSSGGSSGHGGAPCLN